jgi:hypothetical protein
MLKEVIDKLIVLTPVTFIGGLGATARYIHEIGKSDGTFRFKFYLISVLTGVIVSLMCGLLAEAFEVKNELLFAICGLAGIGAKELIEYLPNILIKILDKKIK